MRKETGLGTFQGSRSTEEVLDRGVRWSRLQRQGAARGGGGDQLLPTCRLAKDLPYRFLLPQPGLLCTLGNQVENLEMAEPLTVASVD